MASRAFVLQWQLQRSLKTLSTRYANLRSARAKLARTTATQNSERLGKRLGQVGSILAAQAAAAAAAVPAAQPVKILDTLVRVTDIYAVKHVVVSNTNPIPYVTVWEHAFTLYYRVG